MTAGANSSRAQHRDSRSGSAQVSSRNAEKGRLRSLPRYPKSNDAEYWNAQEIFLPCRLLCLCGKCDARNRWADRKAPKAGDTENRKGPLAYRLSFDQSQGALAWQTGDGNRQRMRDFPKDSLQKRDYYPCSPFWRHGLQVRVQSASLSNSVQDGSPESSEIYQACLTRAYLRQHQRTERDWNSVAGE
jgi:hypothetical protein